MNSVAYITILALAATVVTARLDLHPLSDDFIDEINNAQSLWRAGRNFAVNTSMAYLRGLMGAQDVNVSAILPPRPFHTSRLIDIPDNFDARDQWPKCASLKEIKDQSACGSCWAVSTTSAMTDRICIKSNGRDTTRISAGDLMSCYLGGCNGGLSASAWSYWVRRGISTGGDYGSNQGCISYPYAPCNHGVPGSKKPACGPTRPTPACRGKCDDNVTSVYTELNFGKSSYHLSTEREIQEEILTNGPVTAVYTVYGDFGNYKSGVYFHVRGNSFGLHAVRVIGWGVENSTPYWLIANSWNEEWGDKGYFKIRRGTNECGIESGVAAGLPNV